MVGIRKIVMSYNLGYEMLGTSMGTFLEGNGKVNDIRRWISGYSSGS